MDSASAEGTRSPFKLDGLVASFGRDLDNLGEYADALLRLPDGSAVRCPSSIISACAALAGRDASGVAGAVRRGDGEHGTEVNAFGDAVREYTVSGDGAGVSKLLDVCGGLPYLLSVASQHDATADPMVDPDVVIRLESDRILWPGESGRDERRGAAEVKAKPASTRAAASKEKVPLKPGAKLSPAGSSASSSKIKKPPAAPSTKSGEDNAVAPSFKAHKFVLAARIPYYKRLMSVRGGGALSFGDAKSGSSVLPASVVSGFALRCILQYAYDPSGLGGVFLEAEPHLLPYLKFNCRQYKASESRKGAEAGKKPAQRVTEPPVPVSSIGNLIDLAKAADYLGVEELAEWCCRRLVDLGHGMGGCQGSGCARIVPKILQELYRRGGDIGYPEIENVYRRAMCFIARWPSKLWKRPLIDCDDEVLEDVLEEIDSLVSGDRRDERNRHRKRPPWLPVTVCDAEESKEDDDYDKMVAGMRSLNMDSGVEHCFAFYVDILQVRSAVESNASSMKTGARWKTQLLQPAIECCLHVLAAQFDNKAIVEGIVRLAGGATALEKLQDDSRITDEGEVSAPYISFNRPFALTLLSQVTIASASDWDPPLNKPVLTDRTLGPLLKGLTGVTSLMPEFQEAAEARQFVVDYLRRNWLSMSLSFSRGPVASSPFSKWSWEEVGALSRELHLPPDELRGEAAKKSSKPERKVQVPATRKTFTSMRQRLDASRNMKP